MFLNETSIFSPNELWLFILELPLEGCMISEKGNQEIQCTKEGNKVICKWQNQLLETFQIDDNVLIGDKNENINGWIQEDGTIIWSTGNYWFKPGKK